jgi:heme A synthase
VILAAVKHDSLVVTLHQGFGRVVLFYSILVAIWGVFLYFRGSNPSGGYLGSLVINEGVVILQGILGVVLLLLGNRPHDGLHFLYGVVALVTLPSAYLYSSRGSERRDSLIFGLAALFLFGIGIRAFTTGQG